MSPAGLHRPQMTPAAQLRINVSLILASFTASIYFVQRHMLYNDLDESIENEAGALWGTIRFEGGRPSLENAVSTENIGEVEHFVRVSDASENVMFDSGAAIVLVPVDSQAIKRALAGKSRNSTRQNRRRSDASWSVSSFTGQADSWCAGDRPI